MRAVLLSSFRRKAGVLIASMAVIIGDTAAANGDLSLTVPALDSTITLRTSNQFAGAVYSLVFRGKEYLDSANHGRLLQSASSFDGYGECLNPTEAGAARESNNENVSVLKESHIERNELSTTVDMGFWLSPGQPYPQGCGAHTSMRRAVNTTATSGHLLSKRVTIGLPGFPNVIAHDVTFQLPSSFESATFEASTAYVPKEFSRSYYYDASHGVEFDPKGRQGEQSFPVILFTTDERHAIGVFSPALPQGTLGYGRFNFPDVNKWNCVFRETDLHARSYSYRCLVVLGTLNEVENTMRRLDQAFGHGKR